jgi:hypothetical protein
MRRWRCWCIVEPAVLGRRGVGRAMGTR